MDATVAATPKVRRTSAVRKAVVATSIAIATAALLLLLLLFLLAVPTELSSSQIEEPGSFYLALAYVHLSTIAPCFLIAVWLLTRRKGTPAHKLLGKIYMALISFSSVVAAFMPAAVGPRLWNHFGFIHLFCIAVFVSVPYAVWAIRRGNVTAHAYTMRGRFLGGAVIAGTFAFGPGRLLHGWLFV